MNMEKAVFIYLIFGKEKFFLESKISIASIFAFNAVEVFDFEIIIYTDNAEYFNGFNVKTRKIDESTLNEWSDNGRYLYRSKIKCFEQCTLDYPNDVIIMMDTDTVFKRHPKFLIDNISPAQSVMHFNEGQPSDVLLSILDKPEIKELIGKNSTEVKGNIWNSGVIGIHSSNFFLLGKVLEFNDFFFSYSNYFATEQYAFSVILENNHKLESAHNQVFHYWHQVYKDDFYKKADNLGLDSMSFSLIIDNYKNFIPAWSVFKAVGLRIRALLYMFFRIKRFRVYYSMMLR